MWKLKYIPGSLQQNKRNEHRMGDNRMSMKNRGKNSSAITSVSLGQEEIVFTDKFSNHYYLRDNCIRENGVAPRWYLNNSAWLANSYDVTWLQNHQIKSDADNVMIWKNILPEKLERRVLWLARAGAREWTLHREVGTAAARARATCRRPSCRCRWQRSRRCRGRQGRSESWQPGKKISFVSTQVTVRVKMNREKATRHSKDSTNKNINPEVWFQWHAAVNEQKPESIW